MPEALASYVCSDLENANSTCGLPRREVSLEVANLAMPHSGGYDVLASVNFVARKRKGIC